jgi:phosphoglycerate dehydrogenase-like enzyme
MKKAVIKFFNKPAEPIRALAKEFPEISFEVCTNDNELLSSLPEAEIFIATHLTEEMLRVAPRLKWIQSFFAGMDHYPLKEIERREIILTSGRGIAGIHFAEYVICALIMLARNFPVVAKNQNIKKWVKMEQSQVYGATLGILGFGAIGKEVAKRAVSMGMNVIALKKTIEETDYVEELYTPDRMDEIFRRSDYVVNLLPNTPETEKIVDRKYFNLMKPTAYFVSVGRGKTVNEEDLVEALQSNK